MSPTSCASPRSLSITLTLVALWPTLACPAARAQTLSVPTSAPLGEPLVLRLDAAPPNTPYWLDVGLGGASPGIVLPGTNRVLPANRPWLFADLRSGLHPSAYVGCLGLTDAGGRASATLHLDELPALVGLQLTCFGATIDVTSPDLLGAIFAARQVTVAPASTPTWTTFAPSIDTRVVYVSALGNDANSGLTPAAPVRSVARAKSLVRHGYPDQLLFRRGDAWNEAIGGWIASGRSASEPMVIGSYGPATARPLFRTRDDSGITFTGGGGAPATIDHVALVGLEFYADARDPASPTYTGPGQWPAKGILYLRPGQNLLVEDCAFRMFATNIIIQGEGTGLRGCTIRRCVLTDAYGVAGSYYGHGLYMHNAHDVRIEDNVIDRNGWDDGPGLHASIFTHNVYIHVANSNVALRRNIISRAGSHGLQLRCGGTVADNLFVRNAIAVLVGGEAGATNLLSEVTDNVILNGTDIAVTAPRGWAIEASHTPTVTVRDNLIVQNNGTMHVGVNLDQVTTATVTQNTLVQWNGGNLRQSSSLPGHVIERNILSQGPSFSNNRLAGSVPFEAPTRSLAAFDALLGGNGTIENFLAQARLQSRSRWLPAYTSRAVARHLRGAFKPTVDLGWPQVGAVPYR
jgi:hypothetical protein